MRLHRRGVAGLLLAACSLAPLVHAAEGMWPIQQLADIAAPLQQAGLRLPPAQLADLNRAPLGAVVALGHCSASFVSPHGLVVTNHHCAHGAIQRNSTAEHNLLEHGFNAAALENELSAGPNARIFVLESNTNVTRDIKAAIAGAGSDPLARIQAQEAAEKRLIARCEAQGRYRCNVYSFFGGTTWWLAKSLEIKDVRLVYAPPLSIGQFGGEADNWKWPRHTGDFAFYRAYVGPDGQPAAFSAENIPYRPAHWLKLANEPLAEGDFIMVAGYPGRTDRYALASEFENVARWLYPSISRFYREQAALVEAAAATHPDIAIRYANQLLGWSNTRANFDSQLAGFSRNQALAQKQQQEREILDWLTTQGQQGQLALQAYTRLQELATEARAHQERDLLLRMLHSTGTLGTAVRLYRLAIEREKPDAQRQTGYQQRDWPVIEGGLQQMEQRYVAAMDWQLQYYWLQQLWALPETRYDFDTWFASAINAPSAVDTVEQGALETAFTGFVSPGPVAGADAAIKQVGEQVIGQIVAHLDRSRLGELEQRLHWFNADRAAFEASKDPAIEYAVAIMPLLLEAEQQQKRRRGEELLYRPRFLQAVVDYQRTHDNAAYPDANFSLRLSFGQVTGYTGLEGRAHPAFTVVEGVRAKETGAAPFHSPSALLEAVSKKRYGGLEDTQLGSVPVNFMGDLDITGGNSGSPVLNADGQLVGLAFDGIWEAVASNWLFDPQMTRMIAVDQRYLQWILQEVVPAPQLLQELRSASPDRTP